MENIYDEKELEEYYDVFKIETERFVEEIFHKGFNKGMEKIWEYLNCAASLNCDKYEELFGPMEITDILREFSITDFINIMDSINASGLIEASKGIPRKITLTDFVNIMDSIDTSRPNSKLIKQYTASKNDHEDSNNIDEEYKKGIKCFWSIIKAHNIKVNMKYFELRKLLHEPDVLNYKYEAEKHKDPYSQGFADLYNSLKAISELTGDELVNIIGSSPYEVIRKTPEELVQIMKPYLNNKEDNDD